MDNTIHILDLRSQRCGTKIAAHMHLVSGITFAGRGGEHMVSCGYDGLVKIWNCRSWALERTLRGHEGVRWGWSMMRVAASSRADMIGHGRYGALKEANR